MGFVNSSQGVIIEIEGAGETVREFIRRLEITGPPRAIVESIECAYLQAAGYRGFDIRPSEDADGKSALILPDMAPCAECVDEIFDPGNRRHRYPFTNCTNCGPRFTIIESLPYDRANTSMKKFTMCPECAAEYHDPLDRRFHAQPNACPACDAAAKEPRRSALGLLYEIFQQEAANRAPVDFGFSITGRRLLETMLARGINAPLTSSAGRLFDAVASLSGIRQRATYEGQAAMELEFASEPAERDAYPFEITDGAPCVIDWAPMIVSMLDDMRAGAGAPTIASRFHNTLAEWIVAMARKIGEPEILLTGGCFQNQTLTEGAVERLSAAGFRPHWHQHIPPNDGGIAPGQVVGAAWAISEQLIKA